MELERSENTSEIARNQYQALLRQMSFEAVFKIAKEEHGITGRVTESKDMLIQKILAQKYGGSK